VFVYYDAERPAFRSLSAKLFIFSLGFVRRLIMYTYSMYKCFFGKQLKNVRFKSLELNKLLIDSF
jgi:hypothetical protein